LTTGTLRRFGEQLFWGLQNMTWNQPVSPVQKDWLASLMQRVEATQTKITSAELRSRDESREVRRSFVVLQ